MSPKIIFEDKKLLVLDKPPGLVVDKSETNKGSTLEDWLASRFDTSIYRSGIVHRLDKDTSGLLLVAKTQEALENLQTQFKSREVKKEYLALVHGLVETAGKVEGVIGRNPNNREKFMVLNSLGGVSNPPPRWAETEYEPLKRIEISGERLVEIFSDFNKIQMRKLFTSHYSLFTLVACRPKTGRTHQIRVHLKYINHPIVCDEKYVGRRMCRLDKRWCPRMFLHARKIGFRHPAFGEWMEFQSELPEDLKETLWKTFLYNLP